MPDSGVECSPISLLAQSAKTYTHTITSHNEGASHGHAHNRWYVGAGPLAFRRCCSAESMLFWLRGCCVLPPLQYAMCSMLLGEI